MSENGGEGGKRHETPLDVIRRNALVFFYAVVFGMAAYGVVKLLIFASDRLGLPF